MSHFCLLRDPSKYVAHQWDLLADHPARQHWLEVYQNHFAETMKHAATQYGRKAGKQIAAAQAQFSRLLEALRADPASLPGSQLNIIELNRQREKALRDNGLHDPFGYIKDRENRSAAELYLPLVRKVREMESPAKWLHLMRCVFAGNLFDLGAVPSMRGAVEPTDFAATLQKIKPRPWRVDDFDRLAQDLAPAPPTKWSKAILFLDNAGSDFILGVMPLARELGLSGTQIILAANELPSLNDITADEAAAIVEQLAQDDEDLASLISAKMLEVVSTGNDIPLIDLTQVSDELNEAAQGAELVVLVGMGRAIESNYEAAFTTDSLKVALLKDPLVAQRVGGELYDCVCKYEPIAAPA